MTERGDSIPADNGDDSAVCSHEGGVGNNLVHVATGDSDGNFKNVICYFNAIFFINFMVSNRILPSRDLF